MKREWIALGIVLTILTFSIVNAGYVAHRTRDFSIQLSVAQFYCDSGERQEAASRVSDSLLGWLQWRKYAHIMLRHSEVDGVSDAYYDLLAALEDRDQAVTDAAFDKVTHKLSCIADMEQMTFGSIL